MSQHDTVAALYTRFVTLGEAYADNPDELTGLALDEVAGQLRQACIGRFKDHRLPEMLQRLLRAVPSGDMAEFRRLFDAIRTVALEHDLA